MSAHVGKTPHLTSVLATPHPQLPLLAPQVSHSCSRPSSRFSPPGDSNGVEAAESVRRLPSVNVDSDLSRCTRPSATPHATGTRNGSSITWSNSYLIMPGNAKILAASPLPTEDVRV